MLLGTETVQLYCVWKVPGGSAGLQEGDVSVVGGRAYNPPTPEPNKKMGDQNGSYEVPGLRV